MSFKGTEFMKRLFLLLSGEHPTLPLAEVNSILDAEGIKYDILRQRDRLLIVGVRDEEVKRTGTAILNRAAMTKMVGMVLIEKEFSDFVFTEIRRLEWRDLLKGHSFAVRFTVLGGKRAEVSSQELERVIGGIVKARSNAPVNLSSPDIMLQGILIDDLFVFGINLGYIRGGVFEMRRPKNRPFFHPSAMEPKLARVLVNLSRARKGEVFLDPFCGSGGLMIEAGLIGCRIAGGDILPYMVKGARENLQYFGLDPGGVVLHDARKLPFQDVDAIATDPPYGRSATTRRVPLPELLKDFLGEAYEALAPRRYTVIVTPLGVEVREYALTIGFDIVEEHRMRVHRSLTRRILILRKG